MNSSTFILVIWNNLEWLTYLENVKKKTYVKKFIVFTTIQHGFWLLDAYSHLELQCWTKHILSMFHIDVTLHLSYIVNCVFTSVDDIEVTFTKTSLTFVGIEVFKEKTLTTIHDLDDWTSSQNSKHQMNVLRCKCIVDTILASKSYLINKTWATLIYKKLFHIVKKVDLIMQKCSDVSKKLKSSLAQINNVHAFVVVVVDWQWCTRLLKKDEDCTWESVHLRFEQLKRQDLSNNEQF